MSPLAETRGVNFELVRHFLGRMLDGEWSTERRQWQTVASGAVALFLPAGMLLVRELSLDPAVSARYRLLSSPAAFRATAMADQLALMLLLLVITGLVATLQWQSLFPTRRDYLALAGLPVRLRQIFVGRCGAVLLFSSALVLALALLPSVLARNFATEALASAAECFFVFFAIVTVQGVLLNALPWRMFTRVSPCVQGGLIAILLFGLLRVFSLQNLDEAAIARLPEIAWWAPPVWFAGLHEYLLGGRDPFYVAMAGRSAWSLVIVVAGAVLSYLVSYRRFRARLLEAPDSTPRARIRWSPLDLLSRDPRQQALVHFMAKTLARSRSHRMIWMAYIGGAVAIMVNSSLIDGALLTRGRGWDRAFRFLVLFWPLACTAILLPGFRHVLRVPSELSANWIFRMTESHGRNAWMRAVERFVIAYAIAPIYLILFPAAGFAVGWTLATRMMILQVLASLLLFEILFYSWQQLPFACSYVPGKRSLVGIIAAYIMTLGVIVPAVTVIVAVGAQVPVFFVIYLCGLGGGWLKARRMRREGLADAPLIYEDVNAAVLDLGIKDMSYAASVDSAPAFIK